MPFLLLVTSQQQLPPEGKAFALGSILIVILLALLALGVMIALRTILLPRPTKPRLEPTIPPPEVEEQSAWKIAAHRIEPLPSPGANDETRGLDDDHLAIDPDDDDDDLY